MFVIVSITFRYVSNDRSGLWEASTMTAIVSYSGLGTSLQRHSSPEKSAVTEVSSRMTSSSGNRPRFQLAIDEHRPAAIQRALVVVRRDPVSADENVVVVASDVRNGNDRRAKLKSKADARHGCCSSKSATRSIERRKRNTKESPVAAKDVGV